LHFLNFRQLAFPNDQTPPASFSQFQQMPFVSLRVVFKLWPPEFQARFWKAGHFALRIAVTMPKAAVYENDFFSRRKTDVRSSWQASLVENKAESHPVD
jgi:hypothetical protein